MSESELKKCEYFYLILKEFKTTMKLDAPIHAAETMGFNFPRQDSGIKIIL